MNYKRLLSACLLSSICFGGVVTANIASADDFVPVNPTKPNGLPNMFYPDLRDEIQRTVDDIERLEYELSFSRAREAAKVENITRQKGSATVTVAKNYPIVPYDPNHPNVKKQAQATITANAKTLAGRLGRGLNAAALTLAVADLIGEGVDWVLDPENNSVRYKTDSSCYSVADYHRASESKRYSVPVSIDSAISDGQSCEITLRYHHPSGDSTFKFRAPLNMDNQLSLDTIAQHIINNDTVNNTTNNTDNSTTIINNYYGDAVTDTLIEQVNDGQHDEEFRRILDKLNDETNSETDTTTETTGETDTETKTDSDGSGSGEPPKFEFPAFCEWAKPVCDFIEWYKKDPEKDDPQELPVDEQRPLDPAGFDQNYLSYGGQCPSLGGHTIAVGNVSTVLTFDMSPLCMFAEKVRPAIIAMAYLGAMYIVSSAIRG